MEQEVKTACWRVLASTDLLNEAIEGASGRSAETRQKLLKELEALERQQLGAWEAEANVLLEKARGQFSEEACNRALSRLASDLSRVASRRKEVLAQLESIRQAEGASLVVSQLTYRLFHKLNAADTHRWRELFEALGAEILVSEEGEVDLRLAVPTALPALMPQAPIVFDTPG